MVYQWKLSHKMSNHSNKCCERSMSCLRHVSPWDILYWCCNMGPKWVLLWTASLQMGISLHTLHTYCMFYDIWTKIARQFWSAEVLHWYWHVCIWVLYLGHLFIYWKYWLFHTVLSVLPCTNPKFETSWQTIADIHVVIRITVCTMKCFEIM